MLADKDRVKQEQILTKETRGKIGCLLYVMYNIVYTVVLADIGLMETGCMKNTRISDKLQSAELQYSMFGTSLLNYINKEASPPPIFNDTHT